jgi:hypothetical protein
VKLGAGKGLALSLSVTVVLLILLELGAGLALEPGPRTAVIREERHCEYDADLGWMNVPNVRIEELYGPGTVYTTNSQRLRAPRDYTPEVPAGRYRVICLGDSFTMGYGVDDADTYPARLSQLSDELEVVNMGLGGFGVDQDYLWFERDGDVLESNALLFCVVIADFYRMTSDVFQGRYPKPMLALEDGELVVHNVPVPSGFEDHSGGGVGNLLQRLNLVQLLLGRGGTRTTIRESFTAVAEAVFEDLHRKSAARGRYFAVVLLPSERHVNADHLPVEGWLEEFTARAGIPFLNLFPPLREIDPEELSDYFTQGHYAPIGNQLVAEALFRMIEDERGQ